MYTIFGMEVGSKTYPDDPMIAMWNDPKATLFKMFQRLVAAKVKSAFGKPSALSVLNKLYKNAYAQRISSLEGISAPTACAKRKTDTEASSSSSLS